MTDPFILAGREYRSRLIVGTGKYASFAETRRAVEAAGAEIVTVAVRRVNITDPAKENLLDHLHASWRTIAARPGGDNRLSVGRARSSSTSSPARDGSRPPS